MFKEALGVLGCDPKVYGLHSSRSGGITSVVKNDDFKVFFLKDYWNCTADGKLT